MRIKEGLVKIVMGSKGSTTHKWHRKSRTTLEKIAFAVSKEDNFYYAKVYRYVRDKKVKGNGETKEQIAYIYWKDSVLTWVEN